MTSFEIASTQQMISKYPVAVSATTFGTTCLTFCFRLAINSPMLR
jgi:hypothetical protein